jgi:hypothetical protein
MFNFYLESKMNVPRLNIWKLLDGWGIIVSLAIAGLMLYFNWDNISPALKGVLSISVFVCIFALVSLFKKELEPKQKKDPTWSWSSETEFSENLPTHSPTLFVKKLMRTNTNQQLAEALQEINRIVWSDNSPTKKLESITLVLNNKIST